jgi:AcrR family transcriptional regulator
MSSTADEIKTAARRLLERGGPAAVSMRRVAEVVEVTPMAIYHHFRNRTALLDAVVAEEFAKLEQAFVARQLKGTLEQKVQQVLGGYVAYALERPRIFDYLFAEQRAGARRYPADFRAGRSPTLNCIATLVREGVAAGEWPRRDEWEVAMVLWAHVHGFVMLYRAGRFDLSEGQFRALVRRSVHHLLHGLANA